MSSAEVFRISGFDILFALPISFVLMTASFKGKKGGEILELLLEVLASQGDDVVVLGRSNISLVEVP